MKLFGDILPFFGFRTYPLLEDGFPDFEHHFANPRWESDVLCFEWLHWFIPLFTTEVRPYNAHSQERK